MLTEHDWRRDGMCMCGCMLPSLLELQWQCLHVSPERLTAGSSPPRTWSVRRDLLTGLRMMLWNLVRSLKPSWPSPCTISTPVQQRRTTFCELPSSGLWGCRLCRHFSISWCSADRRQGSQAHGDGPPGCGSNRWSCGEMMQPIRVCVEQPRQCVGAAASGSISSNNTGHVPPGLELQKHVGPRRERQTRIEKLRLGSQGVVRTLSRLVMTIATALVTTSSNRTALPTYGPRSPARLVAYIVAPSRVSSRLCWLGWVFFPRRQSREPWDYAFLASKRCLPKDNDEDNNNARTRIADWAVRPARNEFSDCGSWP
jgi:hypothetical protein